MIGPTPAEYLDHLRAEGERLERVALAADLDRPVPTCPGWTVADAVVHTGEVFAHKVAVLRAGARPEEGQWPLVPPDGESPVAWYRSRLDELLAELTARDPADPAWTWDEQNQTVGFWYRRMAQEVAVHRVDVEDGAGVPVTPVPADLAADGVDELLTAFISGDWSGDDDDPSLHGQRVQVVAGSTSWTVTVDRGSLHAARAEGAATSSGIAPDAWIRGQDPHGVLLYLWGRRPADGLDRGGDAAALEGLRRRLHLVTSD
jgi:uncharacterized protein (TIGR03083 family)